MKEKNLKSEFINQTILSTSIVSCFNICLKDDNCQTISYNFSTNTCYLTEYSIVPYFDDYFSENSTDTNIFKKQFHQKIDYSCL